MKRKFLFVTLGVVAVLLVAAFLAGKAFATVNCFTDTIGNWAETEICWLKDNGIASGYGGGIYGPNNNITRAEMAVMLRNQAEVPPDKGLILITPGNGEWVKLATSGDILLNNYTNKLEVVKTTAGGTFLTIQPSVPTVLYDRIVQLVGVDFCYTATTDTYLGRVALGTVTATAGPSNNTWYADDHTPRTDSACRYYILPAPVNLTPFDGVELFIQINWNAGGAVFGIGRTTFVFQPTDIAAPLIPLSDTVVPLSKMDATGEVPGTSTP